MANGFWLAVAATGALCAQADADSKEPRFEDYPADVVTHLKPAAPIFKTGGQRRFRSMIREALEKGVNFAGHYTVAEWGCGSGCVQVAVVDAQTGEAYDGPFGALPRTHVSLIPNVEADKTGLSYHEDSFLLVVRGCPNEKDCGAYFFEWTGSQFKLLRKIPIKTPAGADK